MSSPPLSIISACGALCPLPCRTDRPLLVAQKSAACSCAAYSRQGFQPYGKDLLRYENVMVDCRVPCREEMRFVTEAEHVHSTSERYLQQFEELKIRLGMDSGR